MSIVPADYPPRFRASDYVVHPTAGEDERIDVGVLFVGAGPAGLAGAIRLGQLLAEDEKTAEKLGEVPIAVVEKGKTAGSHLMSGAVMRPGPLKSLFPELTNADFPILHEVTHEAMYFLTKGGALRAPVPPPQMHNKGNWVVSVSQLGRWLAEQAEELGAYMLPETEAQKLIVDQGRVLGVVTGDKGRGKEGEELGTFEPGMELHARVTAVCEGTQGHIAGIMRKHFDMDQAPQTYELGVKEVWEVPKPLTKLIHTAGWPLRIGSKYREYGGSWIYPMGDDKVSLGFVVGLDYADATTSVHDILQQFKQHKLVQGIIAGGRRVAWGAKTLPGGGFYSLPNRFHVPGAVLCGDAAGFINMSALKGVHYAIQSGILAAEAIYDSIKADTDTTTTGLWGYDKKINDSFIHKDLWRERNVRPAFQQGFVYGAIVGGMATATMGHLPRHVKHSADAKAPIFIGDRDKSYPKPDGTVYFDKLSSVFASGNKTRDDQPSHIRVQTHVPRELGLMWEWMCPAKVYEVEGDGHMVDVKVNPSNCVQCGAITAKGGQLTPPEGGSGPEYSIT